MELKWRLTQAQKNKDDHDILLLFSRVTGTRAITGLPDTESITIRLYSDRIDDAARQFVSSYKTNPTSGIYFGGYTPKTGVPLMFIGSMVKENIKGEIMTVFHDILTPDVTFQTIIGHDQNVLACIKAMKADPNPSNIPYGHTHKLGEICI